MFRFTIRDVLWLTVVVAVLCAWGVHQQRLKNEIARKQIMEVTLDDIKHNLRPGWELRVHYVSEGENSVSILPIGTP